MIVATQFLLPFIGFKLEPMSFKTFKVSLRSFSNSKLRAKMLGEGPFLISDPKVCKDRFIKLGISGDRQYPRMRHESDALTCRAFVKKYERSVEVGEVDAVGATLQGRIGSIRYAGSKLVFIDIIQDGQRVQGLGNLQRLTESGVTREGFRSFFRSVRRGDILSLHGYPQRTASGELSIQLTRLPELLSPCLHPLPIALQDKETRIRNRHVDFLVNPRSADVLRLRSHIVQYVRRFLIQDCQIEVQTPIIADGVGGALARPFQTSASEFPGRNIHLRIAPELWLKRMIVGGFERVFEIGPSFRNEGLDNTHNPEFTICEFYRTYTDLEKLIRMTEDLFSGLAEHINTTLADLATRLAVPQLDFTGPLNRIDFIPAIEAALGGTLPDLSQPDATTEVAKILKDKVLPTTPSMDLPQMLDQLSATYLEPQCKKPTWIIYHPECLSPLSKSFAHPKANQQVSARAELFVNNQELVNTYEEENSPFDQRRKFENQLAFRGEGNDTCIDESYLEALEWGLPPTGGWGCGIDRLCMLMTGVNRIGDVLSFGTLRNVVSLNGGRTNAKPTF